MFICVEAPIAPIVIKHCHSLLDSSIYFISLLCYSNESCTSTQLLQLASSHICTSGTKATKNVLNCGIDITTILQFNSLPLRGSAGQGGMLYTLGQKWARNTGMEWGRNTGMEWGRDTVQVMCHCPQPSLPLGALLASDAPIPLQHGCSKLHGIM